MIKAPEKERTYDKPVAWLVGRDLLGGLKGMILYTAYGSKLDPRDWMSGEVIDDFRKTIGDKEEFWFDYLADAGDGTKAMYAIAYFALSDLWQKAANEPTEDGKIGVAFEAGQGRQSLPRGEFLFIGGDTAYHNADYLTLADRLQRPFTYAFEDLIQHVDKIPQRPLFGIPGNHDYYDQVDGFRRQFRKPVREEPPQPPQSPGGDHAQLGLAGFERRQPASYLALGLPFKWWLWGLDTETGPLDNRQKDFFAEITDTNDDDEVIPPRKLIVATSSPSTIFGKVANDEDFKATKALKELFGESQPFFPNKRADGTYDFSTAGDACIEPGHCRLDISGDVHHYARYWGPATGKAAREKSQSPAPSAKSYASVVSGLGGAFHHPSNTYDDELQEQVLWPTEKQSREAVGPETFNFWSIRTGGYVWLFGFIIASVIYFALSVTQSSRQDLSNIGPLPWVHLGLVQQEPIRPTTRPGTADYFFINSGPEWPTDLFWGTILILASVVVTFATFFMRELLFGPADINFKESQLPPDPFWKIAAIVLPTTAAIVYSMFAVGRYRDQITPFVSSLMVLFTMIVAAGGIVLTVRYNDYLFQKGHHLYLTTRDRIWPWVLPILSILVLAGGLSGFGRNNLPALLVTDIVFTLVVVGVVAALIALPFTASGELLYGRSRWISYPGKALIGVWHLILQLAVPFVLIRKGNWWAWGLAAVLLVAPTPLAAALFKKNRRLALSVIWVLFGAIMLTLPWITAAVAAWAGITLKAPFLGAGWLGNWGIIPALLAGIAGAAMSCLWFGWYLGVCSIFNGHNNEIGGAARIEKFKEFIRFRITRDGLTGFVIGVDDVSIIGEPAGPGMVQDGRDLRPKLIDVFHLKVKT
jgi:hypothetical protein